MNLVRLLLRGSWRLALVATAAGVLSGASMLGLVALVHAGLGQAPGRSKAVLGCAFAALCIVAFISRVASQALLVRLSQKTVSATSQVLCAQILETPLARLEELGTHRLLTILTGDVLIVGQALNGLPMLCVNAATLGGGLAYLAWLSPAIGLAAALLLALGVISYRFTAERAVRYLKHAREEHDRWMRHVRSLVRGIKELQLHQARREEFLSRDLAGADTSMRAAQTSGLTLQAIAVTWGRLLFFVAIGLLIFGLPAVRSVDSGLLAGATLTILYLTGPVESIIGWLPVLARAKISLAKVEELGLSLGEDRSPARTEPGVPVAAWERLDLLEVCHAYQSEREDRGFLLGPIDLSLRPGEIVFVAGGNGSGKSTLVKLVTGLYAPEGGSIKLDGREVVEDKRDRYRGLFSAVFAEVHLFDSLLGLDGPMLDSKARGYLEQLHLDHKVDVDRGVFSTTELSKGQRKRLALVTAYLEDRPIYVFDEWAADQDPLFKDVFYTRILPDLRSRGKCVLAVTHDEAYFHLADRIVRLRDGKIHDETWDYDREPCDESMAGPA